MNSETVVTNGTVISIHELPEPPFTGAEESYYEPHSGDNGYIEEYAEWSITNSNPVLDIASKRYATAKQQRETLEQIRNHIYSLNEEGLVKLMDLTKRFMINKTYKSWPISRSNTSIK